MKSEYWAHYYQKQKNTDTLIKETKTRTQETHEFNLRKFMDIFPINTPLEVVEEKIRIAVTKLEVYISVFKRTEHNNVFTIHTLGYRKDHEVPKNWQKVLEQRNSNQKKSHVDEKKTKEY